MEGSVGLAVLCQHEASIRDTIAACSDIQVIADRLVAKCFIERNREREIMEGYPARNQSKLLLEAVMTQVKLSNSKFKVFVSILEEQPSLKDLVAKLQEEYRNPSESLSPTLTRQDSTSSDDSGSSPEELMSSALEREWALLITALAELLDEKALERMKTALEQLVLSKPAKNSSARPRRSKKLEKCAPIVASCEYKEAKSVREFFKLLAPRWSWVECSLLEFVIKASRCKPAMEKFQEFLGIRKTAASTTTVPVVKEDCSTIQTVSNGETLPQPESEAPTERRGLLPLETSNAVGGNHGIPEDIGIEEKLDKDALTLEEYDQHAGFLCGITAIPRYLLEYIGARDGCIALQWRMSSQLLPLHLARITDEDLKSLAELKVVEIRIGAYLHLAVPTIAYWEGKREVEHPEIFGACIAGDLEEVLQCLSLGVDVNVQDEHDQSPLIVASRRGRVAIVQALLERGAYIHAHDEKRWTALARASCEGYVEVADTLLKAGAKPDSSSAYGVTALMYASSRGHSRIVDSLLKFGAKPNLRTLDCSSALMKAADKGHSDIIVKLLHAKADVDMQNQEGTTALMEASNRGYLDAVKELLAGKANVNMQDENHETALAKASYFGYYAVVQELLQAGAEPDICTQDGRTPLMRTVKRLHDEKLQKQLRITRDGRYKTIAVLLDHKANPANPNIKEPLLGWTALFFAAKDGDVGYVKLLLEHGANTTIKDKNKLTALDVARTLGHSEVCEELMKRFDPEETEESKTAVGYLEILSKAQRKMATLYSAVEERLRRKKLDRSSPNQDEGEGNITLREQEAA